MNNIIEVGKVIEISGIHVIAETNNRSNDLTLFHNGEIYNGLTVGQYVGIIRGPLLLVGKVEKEYLTDEFSNQEKITFKEDKLKRKIDIRMLGFFRDKKFQIGLIAFPMIYNKVVLLSANQINSILFNNNIEGDIKLMIGKTIDQDIEVTLDPFCLFNTHIGIFGNTGSGKSNTLAKIYAELFKLDKKSIDLSKSKFVFLDFNGEYVGGKALSTDKDVLKLSTSSRGDKLSISKEQYWDIETLSIIFSATEKTQKPFLKNAIKYFLDEETLDITSEKIKAGIESAFWNTFKLNKSKETNNLLHLIYNIIGVDKEIAKKIPLYNCLWHSSKNTYYQKNDNNCIYINSVTEKEIVKKREELGKVIKESLMENINNLRNTEKLKVAIYSQLIFSISYGKAQYEHISPLLSRLDAGANVIDKILKISEENLEKHNIKIVSLKNCNIEAKKMIALLLAKNTYHEHKKENKELLNSSFNLIIDEAHNILSEQSKREESSWKDYRLEVFEEIIKEGRKFGYYITMSSQRPADISATLVSQLHNYFIHRLVSDIDLKLINNTINTLDFVSKSGIPILAPGQCIVTGTSFSLPICVQVEKLDREVAPNSESADLKRIWNLAK